MHVTVRDIQRRLSVAGHEYSAGYASLLYERIPIQELESALRAVDQGYPVPVLAGLLPFLGLDLKVTENVLMPGPETAALTRTTLVVLAEIEGSPSVLEIGTGSGAIAVSLAHHHRSARITATDISPGALEIAQVNAQKVGVSDRVRLIRHDCREHLDRVGPFDVVVSNPPYVATNDVAKLPPQWSMFTPRIAVDGGGDGLSLIRAVVRQAAQLLRAGGYLVLECDDGQRATVEEIIAESGSWAVRSLCGRAGEGRVIVARFAGVDVGKDSVEWGNLDSLMGSFATVESVYHDELTHGVPLSHIPPWSERTTPRAR